MLKDENALDKGIRDIIDIMLFMYEKVKGFLVDLNEYYTKYKDLVMESSTRMNEEMSKGILFTLQTKQSYLIKHYGLNSRTVNNIFDKLSKEMDFNEKILGREKLF